MTDTTCPHCRSALPGDAVVCRHCGRQVQPLQVQIGQGITNNDIFWFVSLPALLVVGYFVFALVGNHLGLAFR